MSAPIIFSGRRAKLLTADAILNSDGSINDNNGIVNLIKNGHAEVNTTGWSTYADAAGTRPVDGTGGSPTVTWTRSTTTPLSGQAHFLFTKDASNRQGEGASYAFTVPTDLKAKVVQIELDYMVMSGTFVAGSSSADSDLIWYIYDVTNSVPIELSSIKLLSNSSTLTDKFIANFQTSATGTSYRLICHVASTSASAYTLAFKNVSVKPCQYVSGTPISDWVSYTPTGSWVTNTTYTGRWRRVGDTLESQINLVLAGAPTAADLTVNFLPSGLTVDSAKMAAFSFGSIGDANIIDSGSRVYIANPAYNGGSSVYIVHTESGNTGIVNATNPTTFASADNVRLNIRVPITGWSSSVQVSDGYDGRLIAAQAFRQTTGQSLSGSSDIKIQWNGKTKDTTSSFDNVTNYRFTVPSSGTYVHTGQISLGTGSGASSIGLHLYKNGGPINTVGYTISSTTNNCSIPISIEVDANANDYFELYINPNGASITILSNASIYSGSQWNISKKQSPTTISATEVVAARYTTAAGQSIPNTATSTIIDFGTKDYDTHNAVTTGASWKFTAPISGFYRVTSMNAFSSALAWTAGNAAYGSILKNGSTNVGMIDDPPIWASVTDLIPIKGTNTVYLLAGEYIDIRLANNRTGGNSALQANADYNYVTIERIK